MSQREVLQQAGGQQQADEGQGEPDVPGGVLLLACCDVQQGAVPCAFQVHELPGGTKNM